MGYKRSNLMQERLLKNRSAIIENARQLIAIGGFKEAQIQAIALKAGLSSGLIYRYFKSKTEILVEVLTDAVYKEIQILHDLSLEKKSSLEKLHTAVSVFIQRALKSPQLAYSLMFEPADPSLEYARFKVKDDIKLFFIELLKEGKEKNEFQFENLNTSALSIVGAMTYAVIEPLNPNNNSVSSDTENKQFAEQIAQFCVQALSVSAS